MLVFVLSILIFIAAVKRKLYGFVSVAILTLLYGITRSLLLPVPELLEFCGIAERVMIILLVVSVFFLLRKGQVNLISMVLSVLACVVRWSWSPVSFFYRSLMQKPEADVYALVLKAAAVQNIFDVMVYALLLATQSCILWILYKKH